MVSFWETASAQSSIRARAEALPKGVVFEAVKAAPSMDERVPRKVSSSPSPHGPQFREPRGRAHDRLRPGGAIAEALDTIEFYQPNQVTRFDAADLPSTRAVHGEDVNDVEMFIRPAAGAEGFWASANARPLRDESGALRGGVVVFRDITERKRVEAELVRSRERFELAVRGSQDGLWDWDPRTGEIYYSPRWKSIFGYEDHEIAHRIEEWSERLHPDDRERVLAANQAHLEGITPHYECEYRLRHKDGTYRWILARGVALRDASGVAYRAAGSHVDITERKQAEEERARLIREQEAHANTADLGEAREG